MAGGLSFFNVPATVVFSAASLTVSAGDTGTVEVTIPPPASLPNTGLLAGRGADVIDGRRFLLGAVHGFERGLPVRPGPDHAPAAGRVRWLRLSSRPAWSLSIRWRPTIDPAYWRISTIRPAAPCWT